MTSPNTSTFPHFDKEGGLLSKADQIDGMPSSDFAMFDADETFDVDLVSSGATQDSALLTPDEAACPALFDDDSGVIQDNTLSSLGSFDSLLRRLHNKIGRSFVALPQLESLDKAELLRQRDPSSYGALDEATQ
jgi:hypothetical protein